MGDTTYHVWPAWDMDGKLKWNVTSCYGEVVSRCERHSVAVVEARIMTEQARSLQVECK